MQKEYGVTVAFLYATIIITFKLTGLINTVAKKKNSLATNTKLYLILILKYNFSFYNQ